MTQDEDWSSRLTRGVAAQIQRIRTDRRMSAQQLADATAELGHPVARSVIANLESGRRDTVTIAELLVFAKALRVPPLLLVCPLGREPSVEVLPGAVLDTWAAATWFTGENPFPAAAGARQEEYEADYDGYYDAPTTFYREQEQMLRAWFKARDERFRWARRMSEAMEDQADQQTVADYAAMADRSRETVERLEEQLAVHRAGMRHRGLLTGALPEDLAHIESHHGPQGDEEQA